MIKLSKRLYAVAAMVSPGSRLADVGTDHGYVPIYLTQKGVISHAIAMDVNKGPLMRAAEHIKGNGLEAYIETRLSDGLKNLAPDETDSVVIAGMGGGLTIRILSDSPAVWQQQKEIILQPQSEIEAVRRYICSNGFCIAEEDMVEEDGKYYPMMRCVPGEADSMTVAEYRYGKHLIGSAHPVLCAFLQKEAVQLQTILESLRMQEQTDTIRIRYSEVQEKLDVVRQAQKEME